MKAQFLAAAVAASIPIMGGATASALTVPLPDIHLTCGDRAVVVVPSSVSFYPKGIDRSNPEDWAEILDEWRTKVFPDAPDTCETRDLLSAVARALGVPEPDFPDEEGEGRADSESEEPEQGVADTPQGPESEVPQGFTGGSGVIPAPQVASVPSPAVASNHMAVPKPVPPAAGAVPGAAPRMPAPKSPAGGAPLPGGLVEPPPPGATPYAVGDPVPAQAQPGQQPREQVVLMGRPIPIAKEDIPTMAGVAAAIAGAVGGAFLVGRYGQRRPDRDES